MPLVLLPNMSAVTQQSQSVEEIELALLLEGIYRQYGFDFRNYALASLRRRVWNFMRKEDIGSISLLQDRILHDRLWLERFLYALSVNVSAMFRDPHFYRAFRNEVVPVLKTYPFLRIWLAGVSMGEEVYSLAILLQEEDIGWVTPPEDPKALAQTIAMAAFNAVSTKERGRRAAVVASRYTPQISLSAYRDLMDRLLHRQHARSEASLQEVA